MIIIVGNDDSLLIVFADMIIETPVTKVFACPT